jgi:hypothetical protein
LFIGTETTYLQSRRQVRVTGEPNGLYQLETSTNEADWTPIVLEKLCGTSEFIYTSPDSSSTGAVYRARAVEGPPLPPMHHVLIVGQSLAIGAEGFPALTTEASDRHLRIFSDGVDTYVNPLYELGIETIASGAALQAVWDLPDHRMVFSNVGLGGALYDQLKRGTTNYSRGLTQFSNAPPALACRLLGHRPAAVFAVHGEGDRHNPDYGTNVRQWQIDYEADIRQITGYPLDVPMFHSQISSWTAGGGGTSQAVGPEKVLEESEANPTKTILICPKYFLPHALPVGIHLNNFAYRWLGEYYGKAYRRVVVEGGTWTPLKPASITRTGAVITARFDVPVPPLVLDTNRVSDPGNYGFEYWDESGSPPSITAVELTGPDTVQITLAAEPTGANPRLRYAYTGVPGQPAGPTTGPRGNLHDSDSEPSLWEDPLFNWCVHFDKPVQ